MNCSSSQHLLELYLDGELSPRESAEIQEHLQYCASCGGTYQRLEELQKAIRMQGIRHTAPAHLEQKIQAALRNASRNESARSLPWKWMAMAASVLLFASITWNVASLRSRASGTDAIAREVLSSHLRSLMGTHLLDVPSSDQHTVKRWFNGKLDFSPDVRDFSSQGFPLVGGRIEYIDDRPVAALVYQRSKHVINLFTWPSSSAAQSGYRESERNGFNVVYWIQGGMNYWAVSDLNMSDLKQFAELYK